MPSEQTMQNLYRYDLIEMRNNKSCFILKSFYLKVVLFFLKQKKNKKNQKNTLKTQK